MRVEKLLRRIRELLGWRALRQPRDSVLFQLGGIFIAAIFEIPAHEEVVLQRFHVLLKVGNPFLRLSHGGMQGTGGLFEVGIELFVVDQRSYGTLARIDFAADRGEIRRRAGDVPDSPLAGIQDGADLFQQVGHFQRRQAGDAIAIAHVGFPLGSKRDRNILASQHPLGFDGGHGVSLDDLVRRLGEIHDYRHPIARLMRQHDLAHRSNVNPAHPYIASYIQARYVVELGLQFVCGAEKIPLASDDEDTGHQNCQCDNDEGS